MANKSGGDAIQGNAGLQGNLSGQDTNSVSAAGASVLEGMGGSSFSDAFGNQNVTHSQSSYAHTDDGCSDNVHPILLPVYRASNLPERVM